jgi:hypothetical protein
LLQGVDALFETLPNSGEGLPILLFPTNGTRPD